jgi:ATP-binding cassette subfamily F protein uup
VLVLDEPTNDLDIETLELLENLLQDFAGTLFLVSHDRRFLDNVVTQTIAAEGDGVWREYVGGYEDWLRQRRQAGGNLPLAKPAEVAPPREASAAATRVKLSYKEAKELQGLPDRISALEAEQAGLQGKLADPAFFRQSPAEGRQLQARLTALIGEIAAAMSRWEELEGRGGA